MTVKHPAKFPGTILDEIGDYVDQWTQLQGFTQPVRILDPFAGVGTIFRLAERFDWVDITGIELEPEWADAAPQSGRMICGDAFEHMVLLADLGYEPHFIITSPAYGNRMADHHVAKDNSRRHTYRHYLGRDLDARNAGAIQWGKDYRDFHTVAWSLAVDLLAPGGVFVLNIKDHIRKGEAQDVPSWHTSVLCELGLRMRGLVAVPVGGLRHGENHKARVGHEYLKIFTKDY